MPTVRFILSYIILFALCMLPMALLGQPVVTILLLLMMHGRLAVTMGAPAYLLGGALSFLSVAYLTHSLSCAAYFALSVIFPMWVGFLVTMAPVKFRFSERMCAAAASFLVPFSLWEMSFIRLSGKSFHQTLSESAETALRYFGEGYSEADLSVARAVITKDVMPLVEGAIPAAFTVVSIVAAYIVLMGFSQAMRFSMKKMPEDEVYAPLFSELHMPRLLAVLWVAALVCVFMPNMNVRIGGINGLIILGFIAGICGLSLADHYFRQVVKSSFIRWIVYVVALEMTSFAIFVPLLLAGLTDAFGNFRRRKGKIA